jgi:succinate dehydrogenase/fumarate reductase cytochrome b subunit
MSTNKRQQQASTLRLFRKLHRFTGAALFIFFFIVAVTGTLLDGKNIVMVSF